MRSKRTKRRVSAEQELLLSFVVKTAISRSAEKLLEQGCTHSTVRDIHGIASEFAKSWNALDVVQDQFEEAMPYHMMEHEVDLVLLKRDGVVTKALIIEEHEDWSHLMGARNDQG